MHTFPDLGEFRLVDKILENSAKLVEDAPKYRSWLNAGDDAAIFDGWLATKDLSVEGTHFSMDWSSPEQAVEKHIVSNVSDISAMGGIPRIALFGLCVNKHWSDEVRDRVVKAVSDGFAKRGITLIGGDTVAAEVGMFSTTLLGVQAAEYPLCRNGAKPGDDVYVAGTIGKSAAGLWILMNHPEDADKFPTLVEYHLNPRIDEKMGAKLVKAGVRGACMDISDGLSSELNHLALSSGVSIEIFEKSLPIDPEVRKMADFYGLNALNLALNGGEEYELLFTNSYKNDIFLKGFNPGELCRVGSVIEGSRVYLHDLTGLSTILNAQAWSHL